MNSKVETQVQSQVAGSFSCARLLYYTQLGGDICLNVTSISYIIGTNASHKQPRAGNQSNPNSSIQTPPFNSYRASVI